MIILYQFKDSHLLSTFQKLIFFSKEFLQKQNDYGSWGSSQVAPPKIGSCMYMILAVFFLVQQPTKYLLVEQGKDA